jgi:signal transduction histidine kinase
MSNSTKQGKKRSILFKVFLVIVALTISTLLFILAFTAMLVNKPNQLFAHLHLAITLIILVTVGFLVAHFIIRRILKPLSILSDAVEEIGKGNLDQSIQVNTNDEFGSLATAINTMTTDIKKMIIAREQLLLDVSHELRTPVTRARLALEMMPQSAEKDSILGDLKEMEQMVTEILESERLKNGKRFLTLAPVNVGDLLQKVVNNFRLENGRIILFPISDNLIILVDENMIQTVLSNIIDNSLKYSTSQNKPIEISLIHYNQEITIQIEDFGQGIPEDKLPFVFEPFYRVDQSRSRKTGGYGLGLHICKQIMDMHGAEIEIRNKPDSNGIILSLCFKEINSQDTD